MADRTATHPGWLAEQTESPGAPEVPALLIAWSLAEPERVGEVALIEPGAARMLGRGEPEPSEREPRLRFAAQRPGQVHARPLSAPGISRRQLLVEAHDDGVRVRSVGRCELRVQGRAAERGVLRPGEALTLSGQLVLLCVRRPPCPYAGAAAPPFGFGEPDAHGLVGEAPVVWALRDRMAFVARQQRHVLVTGPSGAGKELVARGVHALSARSKRPFVSRNAATFPAELIDAELFGNVKNYPNPGMPDRPGLVGEADGGTLFLDEIGELPEGLQAHLLRLLDQGEYQRLGEGSPRRASLLVIAATNRPAEALKHDLLQRFALRIAVPSMDERREDIPLLARRLLLRMAQRDRSLAERFFEPSGEPRLSPELVELLLARSYAGNHRELEALLLEAIAGATKRYLHVTDALRRRPDGAPAPGPPARLDEASVRQALSAHAGSVSKAAAALGLRNRDQLYRLMKKLGIGAG